VNIQFPEPKKKKNKTNVAFQKWTVQPTSAKPANVKPHARPASRIGIVAAIPPMRSAIYTMTAMIPKLAGMPYRMAVSSQKLSTEGGIQGGLSQSP